MAWVKLDDQFADHPKLVAVGPLAGWLYVVSLTYASRYLTDGFIPGGQVRRLADVENAQALADKLVSAGLWEEVEGGYQIHDYLHYNPTAAQVRHERDLNAKRQQEFRERKTGRFESRSNGVTNADDNGVTNATRNAQNNGRVTPAPSPSPSRPLGKASGESEAIGGGRLPTPIPKPKDAVRRAERATRLPEDFPITDEMRDWAARRVPQLDLEYAHEEFCTYWRGEGKPKLDWVQTWQNGMLKAAQRQPSRARASPRAPAVNDYPGDDYFTRLAKQREAQRTGGT